MTYEFGYTLTIYGESRDTVLGIIDESKLAAKQAEMDAANRAERRPTRPTIGGKGTPATYWVRPR